MGVAEGPPLVSLTLAFIDYGLPGEPATGFICCLFVWVGIMNREVRGQLVGVKSLLLLALELELKS